MSSLKAQRTLPNTQVRFVSVLSGLAKLGLGDLVQKNYLYFVIRQAFPEAAISLFERSDIVSKHRAFYSTHSYVDRIVKVADSLPLVQPERGASLAELHPHATEVCIVDPFSVLFRPTDAQHIRATRCVSLPSGANRQWPEAENAAITDPIVLPEVSRSAPDLVSFYETLDTALNAGRTLSRQSHPPPFRFVANDAVLPGAGQTWVALHTGCADHWNRRWPLDHFRELAGRVAREFNAGIVLLGGAGERDRNQTLRQGLLAAQPAAIVKNAAGASINDTASMLARSALLIGNDSAMMHFAAALRRPSICLYGPTQASMFLWEKSYTMQTMIKGTCDCKKGSLTSPCVRMHRATCAGKFENYPDCLAAIGVDRVWAVVKRHL